MSTAPLLTAREVAKLLGMSVRWVQLHASGQYRPHIPCVRLGERSVRFRHEDIARFIEQQLERAA